MFRASQLFAGTIVILAGCGVAPHMASRWTAFVYPDVDAIPNADQVQNYTIGTFPTFESCQQAAVDRVRFQSAETGRPGAYQCGRECRHKEEYGGLLICKEIRK